MSHLSKVALIKEMIDSAESNLRSAKQLLNEMLGGSAVSAMTRASYASAASKLGNGAYTGDGARMLEGIFDGKNMIGPDGKVYPVPANYASKSKLVQGDTLKLTITDDGSFIYKQISPTERKRIVGPLTQDDGQYKVIAGGRAYKILLASVTFYKAEPGDQVAILVPEVGDAECGAVDNVIPKIHADIAAEATLMQEAEETAHIISEGLGNDDEAVFK